MTTNTTSRLLGKYYHDIHSPSGFASANQLQKTVYKETGGLLIPLKKIDEWLITQPEHSIFRKRKSKIQKRRIQVYFKNQQFMVDLLELSKEETRQNNGYRYILVAIDTFTKYAYARPLLDKSSANVALQMESIIDEAGMAPSNIHSDLGKEFEGSPFMALMKKYGIMQTFSTDSVKSSVIERFIRTFRQKLIRYQHYKGSLSFINALQDIIHSYNLSYHSSIKDTPEHALFVADSQDIFEKQFGRKNFRYDIGSEQRKKPLSVGNTVRLAVLKHGLHKLTRQENWTVELFRIAQLRHRFNQPIYVVQDQQGNLIRGSFLREELLHIPDANHE